MARKVLPIAGPYGGLIAVHSAEAALTASVVYAPTASPGSTNANGSLALSITSAHANTVRHKVSIGRRSIYIGGAAGTYTIDLAGFFPLGSQPSEFDVRVTPLNGAGEPGPITTVRAAENQTSTFSFTSLPAISADNWEVGTDLAYTMPGTSVDATLTAYLQRESSANVGTDVGLISVQTKVPNYVGQRLRLRVQAHIDGVLQGETFSDWTPAVVAVPAGQPSALTAAMIEVEDSAYRPTSQTTWFTSKLTLVDAELPAAYKTMMLDPDLSEFRWTLTSGDPTDANTEQVLRVDDTFEMIMDDEAKRYTGGTNYVSGVRQDFSVHRSTDTTRSRVQLQYRVRPTSGTAWSPWSPKSVAFSIPIPVADDVDVDEARMMIFRLPAEKAASANLPEKWATGNVGGEGLQWMHGHSRGVSDPGKIVSGQDMGALRCSEDGGTTWYSPLQIGLKSFQMASVFVDPVDSNVGFALAANGAHWESADTAQDGIYRTTDFWRTASLVQAIPNVGRTPLRWAQKTIARWPVVGTSTDLVADAKYRVLAPVNPVNKEGTDHLLYGSTGGISWSAKGSISLSTWGRAGQLLQHPTTENTLFAVCEKGILRTTNWNATTPSWAKWGGTRFDSAKPNRMWIDPDDTDVIMVSCTVGTNRGLHWTTDGGSTWTIELSAIPCANVALGAKNASGKRVCYVHSSGDAGVVNSTRRRVWNGSGFDGSWAAPTKTNMSGAIPVNGLTTPWRVTSGYSSKSYSSFCEFLPHPTDPLECVSYGYHYWWSTDDGAVNWYASNSYNGGVNVIDICFSPDAANWDQVHLACADIAHGYYSDLCRVATSDNITDDQRKAMLYPNSAKELKSISTRTTMGMCVIPDTASDTSKRGRIIMTCGTSLAQGIFVRNKNATSWTDFATLSQDNGGSTPQITARPRVDFEVSDPKYVYAGFNKSSDYGDSWSKMSYRMYGVSKQNAGYVFGTGSSDNKLYRSTDRGASWSVLYTANTDIKPQQPPCWLDPTNDQRTYTIKLVNGVIEPVLIKGTPGSITEVVMPIYVTAGSPPKGGYRPRWIAVDPRDSRYVYVALGVVGGRWLYRGYWNADYTAITWTNITRNLPRVNVQGNGQVSPHTGELIVPTVNGLFVVPPPPGYKAAHSITTSIWENMPKAVDNHWRLVSAA